MIVASGPTLYTVAVQIFLVRHGETTGNASRVVQHPDNPLSPRGLAQAERLARRLAGAGIAHIVSSDFARAAATAEALRRVLGVPLKWENTSLTICAGPAPWRVGLLNCVAHLDDLDAAPLADSGAV